VSASGDKGRCVYVVEFCDLLLDIRGVQVRGVVSQV
jgi:hypothetical protein